MELQGCYICWGSWKMAKGRGRGNAEWAIGLHVVLVAFCCLVGAAEAVQHQVGGTAGWTLPSIGNVNYTLWESTQTFKVGDTLYFNYSKDSHDVLQVTEADYQNCSTSSPIATWDDGATVITLNKSGSFYYICGFTGHCAAGQKLYVQVQLAANASGSPSPLSSSPASPTAPTTSPSTSSSSSSGNSAPSAPPPTTSSSSPPSTKLPAFSACTLLAIITSIAFSASFI